jgi:hypothetical protein
VTPANPEFQLPQDLDAYVWRYMNLRKFHSMLADSAIYLCRADRLERFEGTYSREQIRDTNEYLTRTGHPPLIERERERRHHDRRRTYISCWCIAPCDLDLMWKGYVGNQEGGVAVRSSPRRLHDLCRHHDLQPIGISMVNYFDHAGGQIISYLGTPAVFVRKDHHFSLDRELRILHWPNMQEPTRKGVLLNCDLRDVIDVIVLSPGTTQPESKCVLQSLHDRGLADIPVEFSRDGREEEE